MEKDKKVWGRILGFKEGDRVRIVRASQYVDREARKYFIGRTGTVIRSLYRGRLLVVKLDKVTRALAFVGIPDDLELLEE